RDILSVTLEICPLYSTWPAHTAHPLRDRSITKSKLVTGVSSQGKILKLILSNKFSFFACECQIPAIICCNTLPFNLIFFAVVVDITSDFLSHRFNRTSSGFRNATAYCGQIVTEYPSFLSGDLLLSCS